MIVDLNLKGKRVLIVGGGREAARKVEALLSQQCQVTVVAASVCDAVQRGAREGKITLIPQAVADGGFLKEHEEVVLVMAVTDDRALNRKVVEAARKQGCYAYSVDDPEGSDFSHPAVLTLHDIVQVAVSTGGRSPLGAQKIRDLAEPLFRDLVGQAMVLQIRLQELMRTEAKEVLDSPGDRQRFLETVWNHEAIGDLLRQGQWEEAAALAREILHKTRPPS